MGQFAVDEGAAYILGIFLGTETSEPLLAMALASGSASFSETTTFATLSLPYYTIEGVTDITSEDWTLAGPPGACTATLSDQTFSYTYIPDSVTFDGWVLCRADEGTGLPIDPLIWCGSISPTFAPPVPNGGNYVLSGISVTMGQCSAAAPSVTDGLTVLDTFQGSGSITTVTPDLGGPWIVGDGGVTVSGGECSPTVSGASDMWTDCTDNSITLTLRFTQGSQGTVGFNLRVSDISNRSYCYQDGSRWQYHQFVGGVDTTIATGGPGAIAGQVQLAVLILSGSNATLIVDGVYAFSTSSLTAFPTSTLNGVTWYYASGVPNSTVSYFRSVTP